MVTGTEVLFPGWTLLLALCLHLIHASPHSATHTPTPVEHNNDTIISKDSTTAEYGRSNSSWSKTLSASRVMESQAALTKCDWEYGEQRRNKLFSNGRHELIFRVIKFVVKKGKRRCYVTRRDLEHHLDDSPENDVIRAFAFGCRDLGTELVFLENEEAEMLSRSPSGGADEPSNDANNIAETNRTQHRYFSHNIQYFQTQNCRINVKAIWMVANMTELRVFNAIGERAVTLADLEQGDWRCEGFRNLVSFSIVSDWTLQDNLHYLSRCQGYMDNVVEMQVFNDSLTSFPEELSTTLPNLRSLQIQKNNLRSPVEFPWKSGFATLPRNLSRTYQYNSQYSYGGALDVKPNLFRKILVLDRNQITNLTDVQFSGEFQYISVAGNGLREISQHVFDNVSGLEFLRLAHNDLDVLPDNLLASLRRMTRLDLQGNQLTRFANDTFRNTLSLEILNIEDNQLEVLQDGLFASLRELRIVKLKKNKLLTISDNAFSTLSVKLAYLDLQHNPLTEVPPIVFLLRGLKNINLEHSDIETLDFVEIDRRTSGYGLLDALKNPTTSDVLDERASPDSQKILSLRNSKLRSIVIYNTTEETGATFLLIIQHYTIITEGSRLTCDCHILNATHFLHKLRQDNRLVGREACLDGWRCLSPQELLGRTLVDLVDNETYCPLEADDKKMASCPDGCTCYLRTEINTVIVDCKGVGLTSLPEMVPVKTTEMWLQNNTIQTLATRPYLPHLVTLNLTSNHIEKLPMHAIESMAVLRELDLRDNWLTSLPEGFASLRQLQYVRLSGNPFRCDCHTRWMKRWLLENQGLVRDWSSIKCSVEDAEGKLITAVPDDQFICSVSASLSELAVPVAVPVGVFLPILTMAVLAFLHRRKLKVFLYVHTGLHPFDRDPPGGNALYDVTVCCDVTARAWVLRNVVEPLENDHRYKVFFYSRDSFVGFTTSENVRHCVKNSRRLVVVLGRDWHKDDLLMTATREALAKCRKDVVQFMTVLLHQILPKDIHHKDVQQYTRRGRYIHTEDKHFLKKLVYEMPHLKNGVHKGGMATKVREDVPKSVELHDIVAAAQDDIRAVTERERTFTTRRSLVRQISGDSGIMDLKENSDVRSSMQKRQTCFALPEDSGQKVVLAQTMLYHRQQSVERYSKAFQSGTLTPKSVFVWYSDEDLPFTLKGIVEPLEKLGHTCILQDRDFPLGAAIQENIVHAVETCTRCVLVLSNHTARDEWFTFTFHVTFDRHLQRREQRVGLVKRDDTDVSRFVEEIQQTVKSWALLGEDDPWFWKRLLKFVDFDEYDIC